MKKLLVSLFLTLFCAMTARAQTATITPSATNYSSAGGSITFSVQLSYPGTVTALSFSVGGVPTSWSYGTATGANVPNSTPSAGATGSFPFIYTLIPSTSAPSFQFTVNYPAGLTGNQVFSSISMNYTPSGGSSTNVPVSSVTFAPPPVAPTITTQPVSVTVSQGQTAAFSVIASGTPSPTYQWRKNGGDIFGATSATYGIVGVSTSDAGSFDVVVSNSAGAVVSSAATLTVNIPPSIATQPVAVTVNQGQTATFTVGASGTPTPTYQWRKNGASIAGATSSVLTLTNVTAADATNYDVVVANAAGSATSNAVALTVVLPPSVTVAPAAVSVNVGAAANFSVTAGGTGPFTYQWRKNGVGISGQTNATLAIASVTTADSGIYDVVITNAAGSTTSPFAQLSINTAPLIVTQPFDVNTIQGQTVTFTVVATGTGGLSFTWRKNGLNISNANNAVLLFNGVTTSILTLQNVQPADSGSTFDVVINNSIGTTTSAAGTLTISQVPSISVQPASQSVASGGGASFSVTASGTAPVTYQWRKNGVAIVGANSSALAFLSATVADAATYDVVVTNAVGSVTSNAVTLTVNSLPVISSNPFPTTVTQGASASFTVTASGTPTPSYQWRKNGIAINGNSSATLATLTLTSAQSSDAGSYDVVVSNSVGAIVSSAVTLTVNLPPTIVQQPGNYTVAVGQSGVIFGVNATGSGSLTYQWRKNGVALTDGGTGNSSSIFGSNQQQLQISNAQSGDGGNFSVVVSNAFGSVTSTSPGVLTVINTSSLPAVTGQPLSQTVAEGATVSFSVIASGSPAPTSYQWQKNGVNLADGATGSGSFISNSSAASTTLLITNVQLSDAGSYGVVVTNSGGSTTSSPAALTVTKVPVITTQPTGTTVTAGSPLTLTAAAATASPAASFQWFKDGLIVSGATSATLSIGSAASTDAGNYTVVATNSVGSATSSTATVVVNFAPTIVVQPAAVVTLAQGATLSLSVVATGVPAPSYQWRKGGSSVAGATSATFTIGGAQSTDSGSYDVQVTNGIGGGATSSASTVSVLAAPSISVQPTGGIFNQGQSTTLSVTASGSAPLVYQWFKNNAAITGAISPNLPFPSLVGDSAGNYYVTVTNGAGTATSSSAAISVNTQPAITTQPESKTATVGSSVTFTVGATGNPSVSFQWSKNGVNLDGAIGSSYTIGSAQKSDAGIYRVAVSNSLGTVLSTFVSLAVNDIPQVAPAITTQPSSYTGTAGTGTTLTVVATGTPAPTYQWRKDGADISGATNSNLTLTGTVAESGAYTVVVSNSVGSVTSSTATVLIKAAVPVPVIVVQPVSRTLATGASATLSVQATGQGPLTYQWRKDGTAISGATSTELALTSVTSANAGVYSVTVTNEGGTTTSANATVTVTSTNSAPIILTQPSPQVALVGGSVTFTVVARGTPSPVYQWRKNGANIAGATNASLTLTNLTAADAAGYDVTVINSSGLAVSALARLTVATAATAPTITRQPSDARVVAGRSATFLVIANGTPTPTYQWRLNGNAISGATNATLTLSGVTTAQAGAYSVVVTNSAGSATSNNANLTVLARSYAGSWFGTLGTGGSFALRVEDDNTGVFLGYVGTTKTSYVGRTVTINDDGTFRFTVSTTASAAAAPVVSGSGDGTVAAGVDDLAFAGTIASDSSLTGAATTSSTLALTAARANDAGNSAAFAGFYQASASGSSAQTMIIVGPAGQAFAFVQSGNAVDAGTGTVDANGRVTVTTSGSQSVVANVTADTGSVSVTITDSKNVATNFSGFAAGSASLGSQRLVNISTRASAGIGAESVIVGFVITGVESKTVLIRAVGPTLRTFGFTNAAAAPRLDLARGSTLLATNIDWTKSANVAEISAAAALSGAFPLGATSADSVILTTLTPGSYTASCSAADAKTGVALVEVYDLTGGTTAQKLVNISTRALAGSGENVLTAGVVVTGSAPKRVLIRAVGPGLAQFGLTGVLARPQLALFNGANVSVATNAGWSTSPDAASITEAAVRSGAFAFQAGSLDAALLVNLAPGNYTAQVTGVGGTSGIALVEIYELP